MDFFFLFGITFTGLKMYHVLEIKSLKKALHKKKKNLRRFVESSDFNNFFLLKRRRLPRVCIRL